MAVAVADTADSDAGALIPLADLLGSGAPPEDPHARRFRERALEFLDDVQWVPVEPGADIPENVRPTELLVDAYRDTLDKILASFAPEYVRRRTGLAIPLRRIEGRATSTCCPGQRPGASVWRCRK